MSRIDKDLMLVGSIPLDTTEQVFRACAPAIGKDLFCIPDGETGDRLWWTNFQCYRVFLGHPDFDVVRRPDRVNGVENWKPRGYVDQWEFRVKPGMKQVVFGDPGWRLGYTKEAVNSYFIFKTLREQGVIPHDVRFQVCIPLTGSIVEHYFRNPEDYPIVKPAYEAALRAEIAKMCELIPTADLAIQWDACSEILDLEGFYNWTPKDDKFERLISAVERVSPQIPEEVILGYHFCYGTLGGWPIVAPKDLDLCVRMSNSAVARSGRRVDFVHMPAPHDRTDDAFYAPLKNLKIGDTKLFLGIIHHTDSLDGFKKRLAAARKYTDGFGVASVCGYGRRPIAELAPALEAHRQAAQILHAQR
ncbi:MAG: hypothetical protein ACREP6_16065 [Candidatus Binataceae bacterium]